MKLKDLMGGCNELWHGPMKDEDGGWVEFVQVMIQGLITLLEKGGLEIGG
jgi:hypothetical protein